MRILGRRRKDDESTADLDKEDRHVLNVLASRGADLTKARHVIHFLLFRDGAGARRAAATIEQAGYMTRLEERDAAGGEWLLRAESTRVVDGQTMLAFRRWFEMIAEDFDGEYAGWEASAKP